MNYHSDLDLIFVYDLESISDSSEDARFPPGPRAEGEAAPRAVTAPEYYSRLVQKFITTLSAQMQEGRLYEIDARLRPSGSQGVLVVSLANFIAYHQRQAQTWERQALLKARPVAGSPALGRRIVSELLPAFIYAAGEAASDPGERLGREFLEMRERIRHELANESGDRYNIKFGSGGLVDIEFTVQYLQLLHGNRFPGLRTSNTHEALDALREVGLIEPATATGLEEAYLFYRRLDNRLRIMDENKANQLDWSDASALDRLARTAGYADAARLRREFEHHQSVVRIASRAVLKETTD